MLDGMLSSSPGRLTTIVASVLVNETKYTLRALSVDKNTRFVCGRDLRFWPKTWRLFYF